MRPKKVEDVAILESLAEVFRSKGYEGASLKDLSEATGLKKASLYHRFPNGKSEMAEAVLDFLGEWVNDNLFNTLTDKAMSPSDRLKKGLSQIDTLYSSGDSTCIFRALSMQSGLELFEKHIKDGIEAWLRHFKQIGLDLKLSEDEANKKALQALVEIQGSLVVTRILNDKNVFSDTLKNIENNYLS